jgi:Rieske Fe-S protein
VQSVSGDSDGLALQVRTTGGDEFDVHAGQCVLATGIPILDRGGFFARLKPSRSYCMAYKVPGNDTIFVATGFDKWGMTNGTAAALALASRILGGRMDWADAFASWSPHELSGIPKALQSNLEVGFNLAKGWITPVTRIGNRTPESGGVVSGPPWDLEARSVVNGVEHRVSPVCPHLGGIVNWNDADESWECPLHGSRFAPDGTLLEGPATRNLTAAQ